MITQNLPLYERPILYSFFFHFLMKVKRMCPTVCSTTPFYEIQPRSNAHHQPNTLLPNGGPLSWILLPSASLLQWFVVVLCFVMSVFWGLCNRLCICELCQVLLNFQILMSGHLWCFVSLSEKHMLYFIIDQEFIDSGYVWYVNWKQILFI